MMNKLGKVYEKFKFKLKFAQSGVKEDLISPLKHKKMDLFEMNICVNIKIVFIVN